jgi:Protein of unknown function (DUF2844)
MHFGQIIMDSERPSQRETGRLPFALAPVVAMVMVFCLPAMAELGGDTKSVAADQARMNAQIKVSSMGTFDVHQMQAPDGKVVNEYVSPAGKVFAVAWHGPFMPDLQQILGTYFQNYTAALSAQQHHPGHRPLNIQEPGFVVQTGGHMRAYFGRAYIPGMLPAGVKADDIR